MNALKTQPLFNHRAARTAGSEAEELGGAKEQVWCLMGAMAGGQVKTPECKGENVYIRPGSEMPPDFRAHIHTLEHKHTHQAASDGKTTAVLSLLS
jgi:hypothetical protein